MHVLFPPELKQQIHASLPVDQGICGYPSRLSHEASNRFVARATVVCVVPRHESRGSAAKQVSLEWTETSGGLWEWWHDPGVPLAFPVERASS